MAQPNAAREPSMDEILASIRRIIESNEPATEARLAALGDLDGFQSEAANDDLEDVPLTVDGSFDVYENSAHEPQPATIAAPSDYRAPQLVAANEASPVRPQAPEAKSLSLADVAARVRAASERGAPLREAPAPVQPQPAPVAESPVYASPIAVTAAEPEQAEAPAMAAPVMEEVEQSEAEAPAVDAVEVEKQDAPMAAIASLVSTVTVEKVARSFQDLQSALVEAERRSLDEIAEEMLKPMLQEWLDDNLPTLVERLVREEIERVVRGPRR